MPNWTVNKLIFRSSKDKKAFEKVMVNEMGNVDFSMIWDDPFYTDLTCGYPRLVHAKDILFYLGLNPDERDPSVMKNAFLMKYPWMKDENFEAAMEKMKWYYRGDMWAKRNREEVQRLLDAWHKQYPYVFEIGPEMPIIDQTGDVWSIPKAVWNNDEQLSSYLSGRIMTYLLAKTGCGSWFEWRRHYWGSKWNAKNTVNNDLEISFLTPWDCVGVNLLKEAAKRSFATFIWVYIEDSIDELFGSGIFHHGELVQFVPRGNQEHCDLSRDDVSFLDDFFRLGDEVRWDEENAEALFYDAEDSRFDDLPYIEEDSDALTYWQAICQGQIS